MTDEKPKSIVELYKELEAEGMTRSAGRGEKATKVRGIVTDIGKQTGKNKLMMSAAFKVAKQIIIAEDPDQKLDRAYFTQIMTNTYLTEKDEAGRVWIDLSKKPTKKAAVPKPVEKVEKVPGK